MNQRLKQEITRSYPVLRRSEKKTADYLLKCGENLKDLTLEKIAEGAGVSQPTVMRFVKALGYRDLRISGMNWRGVNRRRAAVFCTVFHFPNATPSAMSRQKLSEPPSDRSRRL